jgi:L-histidine N-alpha-methyltransferase
MTITLSTPASAARITSLTPELAAMAAELRQTLTDVPPWIPSKYLYDDRGSALFEEITRLPEYYPTRTEEALLESVADEIVTRVDPVEILELGSGVGRKIRTLLDRVVARPVHPSLVLVDINARVIADSIGALRADYPGVSISGWTTDFEREAPQAPRRGRRLMVFFAGTIGNLHPDTVPAFLAAQARALEPGDAFLIGVDLVKDRARLHAAYNDTRGVTARFNLNVLQVLNDRLGADFDVAAFEHVAFFDEEHRWIEMRVRARRPTRATIPPCRLDLAFAPGDEIRTEISCKYTRETFRERVAGSGFVLHRWFTDPQALFALALLVRAETADAAWPQPPQL